MLKITDDDLKSFYTAAELAELHQQFAYMVDGQPVTFLIVDPGATNRRIIYAVLQQAGYENIYEAKNGAEALGQLGKITGKIIVTFVDEAVTAPLDYLVYLRQFRQMFPQGVAFLTHSHLPPEKIAAAKSCGVVEVFQRPLRPDFIAEKVKAAVN
jgi:CheY-like chemotaxis protein